MINHCWCGNTGLIAFNDDYLRCPVCETLVINRPFPENLVPDDGSEDEARYGYRYWEEEKAEVYKKAGYNDLDEVILFHYRERALYWVRAVLPYLKKGGSLLEIGCGIGTFSHLMRWLGFRTIATELSSRWRSVLTTKFGMTVVRDAFSECPDETFDVVAAFDVLEHVADPLGMLKEVASRMPDDGILILQTPCYTEGVEHSALSSEFLPVLLPDEHLYLYSWKAVVIMLERAGFAHVVRLKSLFGHDMLLLASKSLPVSRDDEEIRKEYCSDPDTIVPYALVANALPDDNLRYNFRRLRERVAKNAWCRLGRALGLFKVKL